MDTVILLVEYEFWCLRTRVRFPWFNFRVTRGNGRAALFLHTTTVAVCVDADVPKSARPRVTSALMRDCGLYGIILHYYSI